jgi:hypothetical protein
VSNEATVELKRRDRAPSAAGAAGRLSVGDYVGESAAHAAQCVRRAGLRPALERSLGCDPALIGTIVAQEPEAGDEQARNGMVTLFVAAPGPALGREAGEAGIRREDQASASIDRRGGAPPDSSASVSERGVRRPRKRRLGTAADPPDFDPPPAPVVSVREPQDHTQLDVGHHGLAPERSAQWAAGEQASLWPSERPDSVETREHERVAEHLEAVFAGRVSDSRARRRIYPRRPIAAIGQRALAWARSHPFLGLTTATVLVAWVAVALASGLGGHVSGTRGARVNSPAEPEVASSGAPPAATAVGAQTGRQRPEPPRPTGARPRSSPRRLAKGGSTRAHEPHASEQATAAPAPAQAAAVVEGSGSSEPEPARGGPFSP